MAQTPPVWEIALAKRLKVDIILDMAPPSRRVTRIKTIIRRIHMYLGLLLLPWLLFFGLSGILFNHPNIGEAVKGRRILNEGEGAVAAWPAQATAQSVIETLRAHDGAWSLDPSQTPHWEGYAILSAKLPDGKETIIWDVDQGRGIWVQRKARPEPGNPHFPVTSVPLPDRRSAILGPELQALLGTQGRDAQKELRVHPRIAPRLRMVATDASGQAWNLVYSSANGELSGRKRDHWPAIGFAQLLTTMHMTHHFPMKIGARWFWALFEDLLGLSMVLWALSGIVMWWQLKKTRRWGIFSLVLALVIAGAVMVSTAQSITFGDIEQQLGPG